MAKEKNVFTRSDELIKEMEIIKQRVGMVNKKLDILHKQVQELITILEDYSKHKDYKKAKQDLKKLQHNQKDKEEIYYFLNL